MNPTDLPPLPLPAPGGEPDGDRAVRALPPSADRLAGLYLEGLEPAEAAALGRVMALERDGGAWGPPVADAATVGRVVARVRAADDAARAAARRVRVGAGARQRWVRVLVVSLGLHAAALVVLFLLARRAEEEAGHARPLSSAWVPGGEPGFEESEPAWTTRPIEEPRLAALPDEVLLRGQETLGPEDLPLAFEAPMVAPARAFEHPPQVTLAMARRRHAGLKRRTLDLLGMDADGTLKAVARGLVWLGARQQPDGSFPAEAGVGVREQTAVALLPFLGEAWSSASAPTSEAAQVVRGGVAWLRAELAEARATGLTPAEAGAFALALSEDYMLSYGRLGLGEAEARRAELAWLAARLGDGTPAPPTVGAGATQDPGQVFSALGRAALARAGVAPAVDARLWPALAAAPAAAPAAGPTPPWALDAYARGAALLLFERGPSKPGFRRWTATHAHTLLAALGPGGGVSEGPALRGTALVLLALQTAYRTL